MTGIELTVDGGAAQFRSAKRRDQLFFMVAAVHEPSGPPVLFARLGEKLEQSRATRAKQASINHANYVTIPAPSTMAITNRRIENQIIRCGRERGCLELARQCGLVGHHVNACCRASVGIQVILAEPLTLPESLPYIDCLAMTKQERRP